MRNLLIIAVIGGVVCASASTSGGYAGAFARIGLDARQYALAGAVVADINTGYLANGNPASAVFVERLEFGFSHMALPLDRSLQSLSIGFHLPPQAAVSLSYLAAGDDNIQGRNSLGQRTELLEYKDQQVMLSFANQVTDRISVGINAKLLLTQVGPENARGFAIDAGLLYHTPKGFNVGCKIENLTGSESWSVALDRGENVYQDYLPLIFSIGTRVPWWHFAFLVQLDAFIPRIEQDSKMALGTLVPQYHIAVEETIANRVFARIGLDNQIPTLGAGIQYSVFSANDSRFDYGLSLGTAGEGFGHLFTWVFVL
ncbi:hypothetical protein ACFL6E_06480 [Candidatus Neomarinimicrobiota bacterium]